MAEEHLHLAIDRSQRRDEILEGILILGEGFALGVAAIVAAFHGHHDMTTRAALVLFGVLWVGANVAFAWLFAFSRVFGGRPQVLVTGNELLIEAPAELRESLRIDRRRVTAVAIDARPVASHRAERHRFHIEPAPGRPPALAEEERWLLGRAGHEVRARPIDVFAEHPNLALLIRPPLDVPSPHRLRDVLSPARFFSWRASVLLLAVEDVEAAERAFSAWGVLRSVREDDLPAIELSDEERRRSRVQRIAYVVALILIVVAALGVPALLLSTHR